MFPWYKTLPCNSELANHFHYEMKYQTLKATYYETLGILVLTAYIIVYIRPKRSTSIRGVAINIGLGGGRLKSGPFLYRKYKRVIKESNVSVSSLC